MPPPGVLMMYWDYDGQIGGERSLSGTRDAGVLGHRGMARILDLLDQRGLPGTMACVGYMALRGTLPYHCRAQIAEIHRRGHEVASHAWTHEYLPALAGPDLRAVLRRSREALEDAIGARVVSFVPPWNAPHRFWRRLSPGLGQFRRGGRQRTDIPSLCRALRETGFRTCRLAFEPAHLALARRLLGRAALARPLRRLKVDGVVCFQCHGDGGFDAGPLALLERTAVEGGIFVAWAHPHSLGNGSPQDERYLVPFLDRTAALVAAGRLRVVTPAAWLEPEVIAGAS